MTYTVYDANGTAVAGDPTLDDLLREVADQAGGYIVNDATGVEVYRAPEEAA